MENEVRYSYQIKATDSSNKSLTLSAEKKFNS